ncbi:hypothetical protein ACLMJK_009511 [Lecanora helva]
MDKASQVLAQSLPEGTPKSFRALADHSDVPRTTLQHRARGRRSKEEKAQSQHYLYPWEAKALVKFLVQQDAIGRPVRIKYLRPIAFSLARQRPLMDRPKLRASKSGALDWNRYDIYNKVVYWFEVIRAVLQNSTVL